MMQDVMLFCGAVSIGVIAAASLEDKIDRHYEAEVSIRGEISRHFVDARNVAECRQFVLEYLSRNGDKPDAVRCLVKVGAK